MTIHLNSGSPEQTFRYGRALGSTLKGKELIFLSGDLGAGKTVFTKGIGNALGINEREIVSPSYTLMNVYKGAFALYHIDLYRIGDGIKGGIPEIDDHIDRGVIVVEWADYITGFYSSEKNLIRISIRHDREPESGRSITIDTPPAFPPGIFS